MKPTAGHGYLKIGDVARLVGLSPSALRSWEALGVIEPRRTHSRYRLYSPKDIKLLKRAKFLRRGQGLNPAAIVHLLKQQGMLDGQRSVKPTPLGPRLRRLRLQNKLSLAVVARATGVSLGFLSALERGQMSASVATLRRLARFYKVNILALFDPTESNPRRVRASDRKVVEVGPGVRMELLAWGNTVMEPHLFRIGPGAGSGEAYSHEGEEFLYILRGRLKVALDDGETHELVEGDSFYFESSLPHRWLNPGKKETVVVWVNTPPTF